MMDDVRQKVVPLSITQRIKDFLSQTYPLSHNTKDVARKVHCKESTARRILSRLSKKENSGVKRYDKGFYIGVINKENLGNLECPKPKLHNIKLQFEPIRTKKGDSPPALNTPKTTHDGTQHTKEFYWNYNNYPYKVSFQFNPNQTITIHLNASKEPIDQIGYRDYILWLQGVFEGLELNFMKYTQKVVNFEISLDYRKVTITPTMLEIRDLLNKSFFRIYHKYSNLTRIEVGTTFEGEKEIYQLFKDFVKPAFQSIKQDEFMDVV